MKIIGANHCHNSQCLCLNLQTEFMTSEYFDCSISLKHLTGFQVQGAVTSQSLAALLLLLHLPSQQVCSHTAALSSYTCPSKKALKK